MQMKKFRKNKGITLIALVVTIIVLLILAGISINMLTGQNGILKRAGEAKRRTGEAQERENIQVAITSAQTEDFAKESEITDETLRKEIKNTMGSDNNLSGTGPWWYNGEKNDYIINKKGKILEKGTLTYMYEKALIDNCEKEDGTCTNGEHLHVGDYVNLTNPTEGSITISASDSGMDNAGVNGVTNQTFDIAENQLNWRVLGENDAGEIELIAGSPMKSTNVVESKNVPGLYMYKAKAYVNGVEILNNICKMYKENDKTGYISSARSVTQSDIDKAVGLTSIDIIKEKDLDKYYKDKNNYTWWKVLGETYSILDRYTPESWLNGKTRTTVSVEVTGYYYSVNSKDKDDAPSVTVNDRVYKMLFENAEFDTGKAYWLASRLVRGSIFASFDLGVAYTQNGISRAGGWTLFTSNGGGVSKCLAVRPVVSLKSNVTNTQVQKITDKTEETWSNS